MKICFFCSFRERQGGLIVGPWLSILDECLKRTSILRKPRRRFDLFNRRLGLNVPAPNRNGLSASGEGLIANDRKRWIRWSKIDSYHARTADTPSQHVLSQACMPFLKLDDRSLHVWNPKNFLPLPLLISSACTSFCHCFLHLQACTNSPIESREDIGFRAEGSVPTWSLSQA